MLEQSITYEPRLAYSLHITAKRYWIPAFEHNSDDPNALTLILLHSTGFHKEVWEPTLERIFELASKPSNLVKIREAWAIDCPNHGESARLNAKALTHPDFYHNFTCEKYAQGVYHFLSAGPDHGAHVDFRKRNLVGIGHSLGGVALSVLQGIEPILPFSSIVIVDPMLSPAGPDYFNDLRKRLVKGAYERRDVWPTREEAKEALMNRRRTSRWHPRVLDLYVKYAIVPHPGGNHRTPYDGFTLACTRDQEAAMYRDVDGPTKPLLDLNQACARIPVHIVFGGIKDIIQKEVHDALVDPDSGRHFASTTTIQKAGHLVPQEAPEELADVIFEALGTNSRNVSKCKL